MKKLIVSVLLLASFMMKASSDYFYIEDGHLKKNGERVRIWSAQGNLLANDHERIKKEVERYKSMGFNGHRTVGYLSGITADGANNGESFKYTKGDNSKIDRVDFLLSQLAENNIPVWSTFLNGFTTNLKIDDLNLDDIKDPKRLAEWNEAMKEKISTYSKTGLAIVWNRRLEDATKERIKFLLNHKNQHTGFRYGEDPVFFTWEISNEHWWQMRILWGGLKGVPQFLCDELLAQWNDWLKSEYKSEDELKKAWLNSLLPGESLTKGNIALLPLLNNINPQASMLGVGMNFDKKSYGIKDFHPQRGNDVVNFLNRTIIEHKKRMRDFIREQAPKGKGVNIVPIMSDTGYSGALQTIYMQASTSDVISTCCYTSRVTHEKDHPTYPFYSGLKESPRLYYDFPWLEQNRVEGKATFVYENMIFSPSKYRAEYLMQLVTCASIQDWDVINFHYWGHPLSEKDNYNVNKKLEYPTSHYWQGVIFRSDEIFLSQMKAAGEIFKNFHIQKAQNPAIFKIGSKSINNIQNIKYGKYENWLAPTAWRYGMRIEFTPDKEEDQVIGKVVKGREYQLSPMKPTSQIEYDWHNGQLKIDATGSKSLIGFLNKNENLGDAKISNIRVKNPENMPFVVDGERFVCLTISATDNKPLEKANSIIISAVSTSFNTGTKINDKYLETKGDAASPPFVIMKGELMKSTGTTPVLVARVGMDIEAACLANRTFTAYDWELKVIQTGNTGEKGVLKISPDLPIFYIELK